ncbi:MAG: hypothetical protein CMI26_06970 [Opitutae bacterium]|nr:hypothetical protein [Opitutae bacterium]
MIQKHLFPLISSVILSQGIGAQEAAEKAKGNALESKITEVTVYADRARVTREVTLDLPAQTDRFSFAKLPSWIDEGSVRVSLKTTDGAKGEVLDVQIRRTYLTAASDEEVRKAQDAVQEISDQVNELSDKQKVIDQRRTHLESIRVFSLDKLPKDAAAREVKVAEYVDFLAFLETSLNKLNADRRALEKQRREIQPEQNARQKRLSELNSKAQMEERAVEVALRGEGQANVVLTYLLAGASWEPAHELRADEKGQMVHITSYAVVRQTTGEDWGVPKLSFSTQNLSRTARIPELDTLLVGEGRKASVRMLDQQEDTYQDALGNYKSQNRLWYFNNPVANNGIAIANLDLNDAIQQKSVQTFAKISGRATTAHFRALADKAVPSDGQPIRLPIGDLSLNRTERIVTAPEASLNAARVFELNNKNGQALLPGKVTLFLGANFLGSTAIEFVGPGEAFSLYAGVEDKVKVSRVLDSSKSEKRKTNFSSKTELQASWIIDVENLSDIEKIVRLADRIPVSQNEEVKVRSVKTLPKVTPDEKGLFSWDLVLKPKEKRILNVEYVVQYPKDYTQGSYINDSEGALQQQSGNNFEMNSLQLQLRSLESKFSK